jgi:hypothetical protein
MQASTRIGVALCVLVAGVALAGLFRKAPEEAPAPAEPFEGSLALRQPDQAPFMAAGAGGGGWRGKTAETSSSAQQAPPPAAEAASGQAGAPPMPRLVFPRGTAAEGASSSSSWPATSRPDLAPVGKSPTRTGTADAQAKVRTPADDWQLHEVVDGDTLEGIAERYFGDRALAEAIQKANAALVPNANILPIGAFLKIPAPKSLRPATAEPPESPSARNGWRKARDERP